MSEPHISHKRDQDQPVHRITEAQESHTVEKHSRVLKYTISMSVRMACFIAAFFVHGWLQWVFLAAAVVLPYVAVVIANGGADLSKREPPAEYYAGEDPRLLESGGDVSPPESPAATAQRPPEPDAAEHTVIDDAGQSATGQWNTGTPGADTTYPADAPTTIDGSFIPEPEPETDPTTGNGHKNHGGSS